MPPKVDVDAWTIEPVGSLERPEPKGRLQRFLAAWSDYSPPKSVEPGSFMIERKIGERYAVDLHNLALKEGYESELVRYRHFGGPSFMVTVRTKGDKSRSFMTDALVTKQLAPAMAKTSGHFFAGPRVGSPFASMPGAAMTAQQASGTAEPPSAVSDDDFSVDDDSERRDPIQKLLSRASLLCPMDLPDETERSILVGPGMVLGRETLEGLDEGAQMIALSLCRMGFFIRVAEAEIVPEARDQGDLGWIPILNAMQTVYDIEDGATPTEADVEASINRTARFFASEPAATKVLFESVPGLSREVRTRMVDRWLERMASGGCSPSATGLHEQDRLVIYGFALAAVVEAANVSQERGDARREGRAPRY